MPSRDGLLHHQLTVGRRSTGCRARPGLHRRTPQLHRHTAPRRQPPSTASWPPSRAAVPPLTQIGTICRLVSARRPTTSDRAAAAVALVDGHCGGGYWETDCRRGYDTVLGLAAGDKELSQSAADQDRTNGPLTGTGLVVSVGTAAFIW